MERQYKPSIGKDDALERPRGVFRASEGLSLASFTWKDPSKTVKKTLPWHIIDSPQYSKYQGALLSSLLPKIIEVFEYAVPAFCRIYMRDGHRRSGLECKIMSHGLALIEQLPTMATRRCRHKFYFANPPLSYLLFLCLWKGSILDSYSLEGTIIKSWKNCVQSWMLTKMG